ncbi:MAG TPA: hypothetical protein VLN91_05210 [Nitrospirota bacterium]|nr:hypothetical protein [Nitrospirota bacterium]
MLGTREGRTAAEQEVGRDGVVIADRAIALNMPLIRRLELSEREMLPGRDDGPGRSP